MMSVRADASGAEIAKAPFEPTAAVSFVQSPPNVHGSVPARTVTVAFVIACPFSSVTTPPIGKGRASAIVADAPADSETRMIGDHAEAIDGPVA